MTGHQTHYSRKIHICSFQSGGGGGGGGGGKFIHLCLWKFQVVMILNTAQQLGVGGGGGGGAKNVGNYF